MSKLDVRLYVILSAVLGTFVLPKNLVLGVAEVVGTLFRRFGSVY